MEVKYNRNFAILFFALGGMNVLLGASLTLNGNFSFSLVLGILFIVMGVQYLRRPHFVINDGTVVVLALIGPLTRTFPYRNPDGIKMEDGKLYVNKDGRWQRVPVYRWISDSTDWKTLESRYRVL